MNTPVHGIHHVTVIAGDTHQNLARMSPDEIDAFVQRVIEGIIRSWETGTVVTV